ncbi:uncharacterized protein LDX57_006897 [Aspergillus melleus]|uniref:uncharacterized protein n=1 Tax=Aspergillus melleus TaxID=138277 RepID=UPI001E8D6846|nr:uncharacterized protein LDX57_006897 [Aspergillus melleus]KAH8429230.1 hypothetical protein LDX57_006897 [Aspergillus melleus]
MTVATTALPRDGEVPNALHTNGTPHSNRTNWAHKTNGINGTGKLHGHSHTNSASEENPFTIPMSADYAYTPRKLRVVTIGAGFSGLLMAHKVQHRFPELQQYVEHTIFNRVDGRVTALFGGSAVLFNRILQDIRAEDFEIEYNSPNPFRFMGNGFTAWEMDEENDLSWYVELPEEVHS